MQEQGPTGKQPTGEVPSTHAAFVDGLLKRAGDIPGLLAAAVSGSWVDGRIDEYSDVDLVLVTQPGMLVAESERRRLASELGALRTAIVGTHVGEPRLLLCLYGEPVLHVDLVFVEAPDLPALGQRLEPLWVDPQAPVLSWPEPREADSPFKRPPLLGAILPRFALREQNTPFSDVTGSHPPGSSVPLPRARRNTEPQCPTPARP